MKATAEIQVIPIGTGVSVRREVRQAHEILLASGLNAQLHAYGTYVEGEMPEIFALVERLHRELHPSGLVRLSTFVKSGRAPIRSRHSLPRSSENLAELGLGALAGRAVRRRSGTAARQRRLTGRRHARMSRLSYIPPTLSGLRKPARRSAPGRVECAALVGCSVGGVTCSAGHPSHTKTAVMAGL